MCACGSYQTVIYSSYSVQLKNWSQCVKDRHFTVAVLHSRPTVRELGGLAGMQQGKDDLNIGVENVRNAADVADGKRVGGVARLRVERTTTVVEHFLSALDLSAVVETLERLDVSVARLPCSDGTRRRRRRRRLTLRRRRRRRRRRSVWRRRRRRLIEDVVDAGDQHP